ncbi:type IV secretion protein Dot [Legionella bononiensis]|uniref:Type IV secretion protein Dot n=1 Tax=Legionella bononiensis TaxID=2793102 RepID=A0ABS1WB80_9GAMM|nr:type IV secretion protein Dot [Legionella bononiensis]MBL7481517.1 type IV secretion protein Dot [Legionella bononiensis]MBL7526615.1 type IV secretion protein Dot [Legionella bononiensis]
MHDKKVLERLIELRQLEEKKQLDDKQMQELIQLQERNSLLANMSLQQMQEELAKGKELQQADIVGKNLDPIIEDYKKQFGKEDWYKEPKVENGKVTLQFPSKESVADFFQNQAEQNRKFVVVDQATQKVIAYSKGDGTLFHGDGKPYVKGDELKPCGMDIEEFKKQQMTLPKLSSMAETVSKPAEALDDVAFPSAKEQVGNDDHDTLDNNKEPDFQI